MFLNLSLQTLCQHKHQISMTPRHAFGFIEQLQKDKYEKKDNAL